MELYLCETCGRLLKSDPTCPRGCGNSKPFAWEEGMRWWGDPDFIGPEPLDHLNHLDSPEGNAEALVIYFINNVQVSGHLMHWETDNHFEEFCAMQDAIRARFGVA